MKRFISGDLTQRFDFDHILFSFCLYSNTFWRGVCDWLESKILFISHFTRNDLTFGIIMEDKKTEFSLFMVFMREVALFCKSLKKKTAKQTTEHY